MAEYVLSIQEILSSVPSRKGGRGRGREKEGGGRGAEHGGLCL